MDRERLDDILRRAGISGVSSAQAAAALLVACVCVTAAAWRFWPRTPEEAFRAAPEAPSAVAAAATGGQASVPASATLVVHVVGAVARPGVYSLSAGSRVGDALQAAGGALGSAAPEALNLARLLGDGEQIAVPTRDEWEALKATGGSTAGPAASLAPSGAAVGGGGTLAGGVSQSGKVNLNTADEAALDALPGVGPSTAKRIIEDRAANGPFSKPEDLQRVSGIGPKKYDSLKDLVTVK